MADKSVKPLPHWEAPRKRGTKQTSEEREEKLRRLHRYADASLVFQKYCIWLSWCLKNWKKKRTELDFDYCQRAHQQAMYVVRHTAHHLVGISGLGMRGL